MISNWYLSVSLAGLFRTLTPRSETTDMIAAKDSYDRKSTESDRMFLEREIEEP